MKETPNRAVDDLIDDEGSIPRDECQRSYKISLESRGCWKLFMFELVLSKNLHYKSSASNFLTGSGIT